MTEYRVNDDGRVVSIWDDGVGVGFEFTKQDGGSEVRWRFRTSAGAVFREGSVIRATFDRLMSFGRERFPREFETIDRFSPECL